MILFFGTLLAPQGLKTAKCLFFVSFQESHFRSDLYVGCHPEQFYIGFLSQIFFGVTIRVGKSGKNLGQKVNVFFRKKNPKKWKKYYFPGDSVLRNWSNIWEVWQFSTHPRCVRVCGKLPKLPNLASVPQNRVSRKYFRRSCLAQSRLCILEWSNWAEILAPILNFNLMATLFYTFYHFDQLLPRWRPPCREQYTVSLCCW